jgi:hypothetical protein
MGVPPGGVSRSAGAVTVFLAVVVPALYADRSSFFVPQKLQV